MFDPVLVSASLVLAGAVALVWAVAQSDEIEINEDESSNVQKPKTVVQEIRRMMIVPVGK